MLSFAARETKESTGARTSEAMNSSGLVEQVVQSGARVTRTAMRRLCNASARPIPALASSEAPQALRGTLPAPAR